MSHLNEDLAGKLRARYRERQDDMPLARLIARIEANLEEAQVLAADAKDYLRGKWRE